MLCARDAIKNFAPDNGRHVTVAAAALATGTYSVRGADHPALNPYRKEASDQAYEMSGLGPEDVDIVQVHDAATIGEVQQLEALGIVPRGEGWVATQTGRTRISGDIPTNTDGGLLAMGHPLRGLGDSDDTRDCHPAAERGRSPPGERPEGGPCPLFRCRRRHHYSLV